jgi:micrococcal nuclease
MSTSDNQRPNIKVLPALALTLITLGLLLGAGAAGWAQDGIDVDPDGSVTLRDGDKLIQVDEACVLLRDGERDLSVGDRCPDDKPQDTGTPQNKPDPSPEAKEPEKPAPNKPQDEQEVPGGTTGNLTVPETTTEPTTESTTDEDETGSTVPEDDSGLHPVTVERAVDGDTLQVSPRVEGADTVRLIGLDTPEMATDEAPIPEPLAEEAAAFTAESLEGHEVLLELDEDLKDDYDRLLAYAWVEDPAENDEPATAEEPGSLFNETLLRQGYAKIFTVEPNVLYLDRLETAEAAAQEDGIGLWDLEAEQESTNPSTEPITTPSTEAEPEAVPTENQEPIEPSDEETYLEETLETTGQEDSPDTMGATFQTSEPPTDQGLQGGTTVTNDPDGGTTMETTGGTTMETTGSTDMQGFDAENLKREATRLAQETLQPEDPSAEPEAEPESEPQEISPSNLDAGSRPVSSASEQLPVSQSAEPPVQVLPDSGGPAFMIALALLLIPSGTTMIVYDRRATHRANRAPAHPDHDRRGG